MQEEEAAKQKGALERARRDKIAKQKAADLAEEEQKRLDAEREKAFADKAEAELQKQVAETKAALNRKIAYLKKYGGAD